MTDDAQQRSRIWRVSGRGEREIDPTKTGAEYQVLEWSRMCHGCSGTWYCQQMNESVNLNRVWVPERRPERLVILILDL